MSLAFRILEERSNSSGKILGDLEKRISNGTKTNAPSTWCAIPEIITRDCSKKRGYSPSRWKKSSEIFFCVQEKEKEILEGSPRKNGTLDDESDPELDIAALYENPKAGGRPRPQNHMAIARSVAASIAQSVATSSILILDQCHYFYIFPVLSNFRFLYAFPFFFLLPNELLRKLR